MLEIISVTQGMILSGNPEQQAVVLTKTYQIRLNNATGATQDQHANEELFLQTKCLALCCTETLRCTLWF
jgi:hypothetical protein